MTLLEKIIWYRNQYGWRGLIQKGIRVATFQKDPVDPSVENLDEQSDTPTSEQILSNRFPRQRPLRTFPVKAEDKYVVMITDSLSKDSMFGGVATAIVLCALIARATGRPLKIVCRDVPPAEGSVSAILAVHRIDFPGKVHFEYANPHDIRAEISLGNEDIIITTSWWTTESAVNALGTSNLFYLLQEDERMFYPHDDDHLRCSQLLSNPKIKLIVNTSLLLEHLKSSGLPMPEGRAVSFEPAFCHHVDKLPAQGKGGKSNFFFYARPLHHRNLFHLGLAVVQNSVERGILAPEEWELHFVGAHIPDLTIGSEFKIKRHQMLPWKSYVDLLQKMDLGLSLMYTPHPSYPPLDLAAAGAIAVTNSYGLKTDLTHLSGNLICASPDIDSLTKAISEGVALSKDRETRTQHISTSRISRSWENTMAEAVSFITRS